MKKVLLASVAVNKAADYYDRADEVAPPAGPRAMAPMDADEVVATRSDKPRPGRGRRTKSTQERLRGLESALDGALDRSYERFCRGEITAQDMEQQRARLIRAFNDQVMSENIRYRSLLRRVPNIR